MEPISSQTESTENKNKHFPETNFARQAQSSHCVQPASLSSEPVPEFIDPVFTKTSPKRSFSLNRKRAFWLVFAKTGSIISGTGIWPYSLHVHLAHLANYSPSSFLRKAVNREDKRSRRYRDRDLAKFERSRRYRHR
jgi:hypothetical protein